jgi:hypothetical protein
MKVYTVTISYDYEGDTLDSIWLTFENAKSRALELLARGAPDLREPFDDTATSFGCRTSGRAPGDQITVEEAEVQG